MIQVDRHAIFHSDPHPKSMAAGLLLRARLARGGSTSIADRKGVVRWNNEFVRQVLVRQGSLWCEYCGKAGLRLVKWGRRAHPDMATVDHYVPVSKGGAAYDQDNLRISCDRCNKKKADRMPQPGCVKFPRRAGKVVMPLPPPKRG